MEREQDMYQWWIFTSSLRTPVQRKWFLPVWDFLWNTPECEKWQNQAPDHSDQEIVV